MAEERRVETVTVMRRVWWRRWGCCAGLFAVGVGWRLVCDYLSDPIWGLDWNVPRKIRHSWIGGRWPGLTAQLSFISLYVPAWIFAIVLGVGLGRFVRSKSITGVAFAAIGFGIALEVYYDPYLWSPPTLEWGRVEATCFGMRFLTGLIVFLPAWWLRRRWLAKQRKAAFPVQALDVVVR